MFDVVVRFGFRTRFESRRFLQIGRINWKEGAFSPALMTLMIGIVVVGSQESNPYKRVSVSRRTFHRSGETSQAQCGDHSLTIAGL